MLRCHARGIGGACRLAHEDECATVGRISVDEAYPSLVALRHDHHSPRLSDAETTLGNLYRLAKRYPVFWLHFTLPWGIIPDMDGEYRGDFATRKALSHAKSSVSRNEIILCGSLL